MVAMVTEWMLFDVAKTIKPQNVIVLAVDSCILYIHMRTIFWRGRPLKRLYLFVQPVFHRKCCYVKSCKFEFNHDIENLNDAIAVIIVYVVE